MNAHVKTLNKNAPRYCLVMFGVKQYRSKVTIEALQEKGYQVRNNRKASRVKDVFFQGHAVAKLVEAAGA